ncbi:MAG: TlpA family protein disulfide reductase [Dehalococcoidia bacterium]|nr:MAG: TlpA family protein disulfide reductase [Dehalococcoidia bacterium]
MASRMSKKLIRITLIIAVLALVGVALSCNSSLLSQKAPDFTLPTMTGANITLSALEGTPVVLNFWATWCSPCRMELPYFEAVAQESEGAIKVIAINVGQTAATVQNFFGEYEPTMIVALDTNGEIFVSYCQEDNPRGYIPITFLVDSEGIVQYIKIGPFTSEAALWDTLNDLFGTAIP